MSTLVQCCTGCSGLGRVRVRRTSISEMIGSAHFPIFKYEDSCLVLKDPGVVALTLKADSEPQTNMVPLEPELFGSECLRLTARVARTEMVGARTGLAARTELVSAPNPARPCPYGTGQHWKPKESTAQKQIRRRKQISRSCLNTQHGSSAQRRTTKEGMRPY